jgi:hypothetical protein
MKQRALLKSQIIKAWNKSMKRDYFNQRINSERSLQASFWSHLNQLLKGNRRLFIEPTMSIKIKNNKKRIIPDIVVCSAKQVISVIELKYMPRAQPKYQKDIKSLVLIAKNRNKISIANERFRGTEKDGTRYSLSKNILFVWAGVHAKEKLEINQSYSAGHESLDGCYLELHAETKTNSKPKVFQRK